MKKIVKIGCFVVLVIAVLAVLGLIANHTSYKGPYTFWRQDRANIAKIEVCSYDYKTKERTVIAELPKEDINIIMDEISAYTYYETVAPYPTTYSRIMVCVTYMDGEVELVSFVNVGYISTDGKQQFTRYALHADSARQYYDFLCRYVDPELLADIKDDYPRWFAESSNGE